MLDELILAVHGASASVWLGGSLLLIGGSALRHRRTGWAGASVAPPPRRWERMTCWVVWPALLVAIATGLFNLTWYFPGGLGLGSVLDDPWVVAKIAVVGVVLLAAGLLTLVTSPRLGEARARGVSLATLRALGRRNRDLGLISTGASAAAVALGLWLAAH